MTQAIAEIDPRRVDDAAWHAEREARIARAWEVLAGVLDPEVPVVSVRDLGIVRDVAIDGDGTVVVLTPTYSGCPATEVIEQSVLGALQAEGLGPARATLRRAPAWTTDWITEDGKQALEAYGIAPPDPAKAATCPQCGSTDTEEVSRFGSTPCKAQWRCKSCLEPFDRFKCH